jgi:bacterioferritin-associated ferredoxin
MVADLDFHLCLDHHCAVGYFNNKQQVVIGRDSFKRPIWFKSGSDTLYACYCKSITEEDVIKTVVETGLKDIDSISHYLKGGRGDNCEITNPTGQKCDDGFGLMIRNGHTVKFVLEQYGHLEPDKLKDAPDVAEAAHKEVMGCGSGCGCH